MLTRVFNALQSQTIKSLFSLIAKVAVGAFIFVLLVEVVLRIVPSLISESILAEFHPETRTEIAHRRGLPTQADTILIQRDDNGPELRIPKPFTIRNWKGREPGTVDSTKVDEMGFCNPEETSYRQPAIDLLSLGDSFIWCTAINPGDTWTSKLATLTGYSTYSLAAIDTGLHEHIQLLKKFGIQKSPKIVIMTVFEGNDLQNAVAYDSFVAGNTDGGGVKDPAGEFSDKPSSLSHNPCRIFQEIIQSAIGRYSYAINVLLVIAGDTCNTIAAQVTPASADPDGVKDSGSSFGYRLVYPDISIEFDPRDGGSDDSIFAEKLRSKDVNLDVFDGPLRRFVELSQQHDFVPVVVYTPATYTAYATNVAFDESDLGDLMPWFSRQQRDYFKIQGSELEYVYLDLTPFLQSAAETFEGPQDLLYFKSNRHLTQRGHAIAADAISEALKSIDNDR